MEQHPVPQPITSYEFRLVGDMTIKQFGKLAAGIILALIVYAIDPPVLIKWFLIALFGGLGAIMAFVPFEGRPVDVWIIAFFKRIYSPTQFLWKQRGMTASSFTQPQKSASVVPPQTMPQSMPQIPKTEVQPQPLPPAPAPLKINIPPSFSTRKEKRVEAKFSSDVVVPVTPSLPNLTVGYVRDKEGKLIEGAILEIRDSSGNPVRAFKTNKLGQFLSATPLHNGAYEIETSKEGFEFDIIKINLEGKILSPIEIVSK